MIRKVIIIGLFSLILTYCNSSTNQKIDISVEITSLEKNSDLKTIDFMELVINEIKDTFEIIKIKEDCVLIIQLATNESESLENANPDSYEIYSENANNAAMNASDLFDRLKIKSIWSDKRYIDFDYKGKNFLLDTRLKKIAGEYCIIFKSDKTPKLIEIELLTEDILKTYFN